MCVKNNLIFTYMNHQHLLKNSDNVKLNEIKICKQSHIDIENDIDNTSNSSDVPSLQ